MGHIFTIYRQIYQFYRHFCKIKNSAVYNRICMVFATQTLRSILKSLTGSVFLFFLRWVFIGRVGNIAFTKPLKSAFFVLDIAELCLKYTKLEKKASVNLLSNHFTTLMQNYVQI